MMATTISGNGMTHNYNPISAPTNQMSIKWDPKNLEIRTHSVEKTLEPLVMQVSFVSLYFHHYFYQLIVNKRMHDMFYNQFNDTLIKCLIP